MAERFKACSRRLVFSEITSRASLTFCLPWGFKWLNVRWQFGTFCSMINSNGSAEKSTPRKVNTWPFTKWFLYNLRLWQWSALMFIFSFLSDLKKWPSTDISCPETLSIYSIIVLFWDSSQKSWLVHPLGVFEELKSFRGSVHKSENRNQHRWSERTFRKARPILQQIQRELLQFYLLGG